MDEKTEQENTIPFRDDYKTDKKYHLKDIGGKKTHMLYLDRARTKHSAMNMKKKNKHNEKIRQKLDSKKTGHMIIMFIELAVLSHLRATSM